MGRRTERVADALAPGAQKEAAEGAPPAEGEVKQVEKVKEARGVAPAKKAKKPQGGRGTDSEDKGGGLGGGVAERRRAMRRRESRNGPP